MIETYKNTALIERMLELVAAQNFVLLEDFERIHLLGVLFLDEEHLSVAALADHLELGEVTHADCA